MAGNSPEPGTPQTADKSVWATATSFLALLGLAYVADDDPFTRKELIESLVSAGVGSGIIGGATFFVRNRRKP